MIIIPLVMQQDTRYIEHEKNVRKIYYKSQLIEKLIEVYYANTVPMSVIGKEAGVSRVVVHNVITKRSKNPTVETVERLLAYFCDIEIKVREEFEDAGE